jgi:hypothetical protein
VETKAVREAERGGHVARLGAADAGLAVEHKGVGLLRLSKAKLNAKYIYALLILSNLRLFLLGQEGADLQCSRWRSNY